MEKFQTLDDLLQVCKKQETDSNSCEDGIEFEPINTDQTANGKTASTMGNRSGFAAHDLKKIYKNTTGFWKKLRIRVRKLCRESHIEFTPVEAIKEVCFKVQEGSCMGLIGDNGTGKTTVMEIISGNLRKNDGKCYVFEKEENGRKVRIDLDIDRHRYRDLIGYCPQEEALCDFMTGKEFLTYLLMIKGYSCKDTKVMVKRMMEEIDVDKYENVLVKHCSFGTRKKWNVAAAMVSFELKLNRLLSHEFITFLDRQSTSHLS